MPEDAWMCQNRQNFEYAYEPKYGKVLNRTGFSICELYTAFWLCQNMSKQSFECISGSKYASVLNMKQLHRVLSMPQHGWIRLNWTRIYLKMSGFTIINRLLNMYHTIHSSRSVWKLMSTYWEIFRTVQRSKMERFGKMIIVFNYFRKKCQLKPLRGFWICFRF